MLAQGIVGSIPWTALVFFTLYLQLLGMSDFAASVLMSLFLGSTGLQALSCIPHCAYYGATTHLTHLSVKSVFNGTVV